MSKWMIERSRTDVAAAQWQSWAEHTTHSGMKRHLEDLLAYGPDDYSYRVIEVLP